MKARLVVLMSVWLLAISFAFADEANEQGWGQVGDEDLRLLEVNIDKLVMEEILTAYQHQDRIMVPLGLFCEILGFAIQVHPEAGTAEGFILSKDRRFFLDAHRAQVTIKGKQSKFNKDGIRLDIDDIYVDAEYLSNWFPLRLNINLFVSTADIQPKEPLPLQQRLERERRIKITRRGLGAGNLELSQYSQPYALWSTPSIDQEIQFGWQRDSDHVENSDFSYTTYASADLLHMESSWYLSGSDQDEVEVSRIKLGRKDPHAQLLGGLRATEYGVGHVEGARVALVTVSNIPMLGVTLSNKPLHQQRQFDQHSFRGDLLPGWEVELYHNNSLLDYQPAGAEGQYSFEDVPLLFGNNYFRLVFYGPQGQRYEEHQNFVLNETLMRKNEFRYEFSANRDERHHKRAVFKSSYGLLKNISAELALSNLSVNDVEHQYRSFGLKGFGLGTFYGVNVTHDEAAGRATEVFLQGRLGPVNIRLGDIHIDQLITEALPLTGAPLKRRSQLRFDTTIPSYFFPRIPVTIDASRDELESGWSKTIIRNRIAMRKNRFAIGNDLVWNVRSEQRTILTGNLMLSHFMGRSSLRGDVNYQVKPEGDLQTTLFTYNNQYFTPYNIKLTASRSFVNKYNQYSVELNKRLKDYVFGVSASYVTTGDLRLNLTWSMNFGREPRTPYWMNSTRPLANRGAISARVFLDKDRDGVFGVADRPLKDVGFILGNGRTAYPIHTDINGIAFIPSLAAYKPINLRLSDDTLEDPLWASAVEGWQIVARPGQPVQLDFPVYETGEIDGTVYIDDGVRSRGARGMTVELVNEQGEVVKEVRTEFDGYYVISNIPLAKYQLRVVPRSAAQFDSKALKSKAIEFTSEQMFFYGEDVTLRR